jgi:ABC-type transport system involved in multi-copper enzyme maturation permease subunit
MIGTVYRFELAYHFKRPVTWLYAAIYFAMAFAFAASDAVRIGGAGALVKNNAPYVIALVQMILVVGGQVISCALVGTAVLRDYLVGAHELLFTTPITRAAYLGGRFLGVLTVMLVINFMIPLGAAVGSFMPWVDHDKLLPFHLMWYVQPYFVAMVPSVILMSALFFAVGALTRNLFAIYTQGMIFLVLWNIANRITADLDNQRIAALVDPTGLAAYSEVTKYWTVAERNGQLIPLAGDLLLNRIIWVLVAVGVFFLTYALFRFRSQPPTLRRKARRQAAEPAAEPGPTAVPAVARRFDGRARLAQLLTSARVSFTSIVREVPFIAIVVIGFINLGTSAAFADSLYGQKVYPVTYTIVETLDQTFALFFVILITIYAGEAVWRERQLKLDQVTDALPVRTWVTMLGKFLGLGMMEAFLLLLLIAFGIAVQTFKGFHHYEPGLYFSYLFGTTLPALLQLTALAFLVHALVNSKFVGHVVMLVLYLFRFSMGRLGIEHQLFKYAQPISFTYSDMNGYGPFVPGLALFIVYWSGVAMLLFVMAYLFWVRGTPQRFAERRRIARERWAGARSWALVGLAIAVATGGAIFWNTNVRNVYETSKDVRRRQAGYEKTYRHLRELPKPRLVDLKVRADLEPENRAFTVGGTFTYVNQTDRAIDTVIVTNSHPRIRLDTLTWDRTANQVLDDSANGTRILRFAPPLAPGDTVRLRYKARWEEHGFRNGGPGTLVVENGTFVNREYFPILGYQDQLELSSDDDRKKEGLAPKARMPSIDDESARANHYLDNGADWVTFEATVSTAPDQIAIAPGYLQREYTENGRRVFEYKMDRPIHDFYSFLSARYAVKRDKWRDVNLEIYYHPGHEYNLDRMMEGMKLSLDYFSEHFSPYQFHQVRILEFPRYAGFAQAFPNTVPYSEGIGFILRTTDSDDDLDMPLFVTAHEVAHQWWGHQVVGANMQGSTLFSEGLAEYSALTVMEKRYGRNQAKKFLQNELDRYLGGRSNETKREMPLLLVENQPYIHYNKGSLALYAVRDAIGEDSINAALSRFVRDKQFQLPPYTTSREFLGYLQAVTPDSVKYLLTDLFETITLWDNKVESATWSRRADGKYVVSLKVDSQKFRADSLGNQTEIPIADLVDVGVFGAREPGNALGKPLLVEKRWIRTRNSTIDVVVDEQPVKAGVDPYNKLIDRLPSDNVRSVVQGAAPPTN